MSNSFKVPDSPVKPKLLTEEQRNDVYGVDSAMKHYKDHVYYRQRKAGDGWFHGRVTRAYRDNYDKIFNGAR
jgi:hypothetical protein